MEHTGTLETERLLLQHLLPEHADATLAYAQRIWPAVATWMPLMPDDYFTLAGQHMRLEAEQRLRCEDRGFRFYFTRRNDPGAAIIGDVNLSNIVRGAFQSCFLGYKIDPAHAGHGYMTEAVQRIVEFGFRELYLHRIEANIMPRNTASRRVVEKAGFVEEGLARAYLRINGVWEDHIHYVILNPAV
jgi:ribosomal-protein-alanine N-acetyltransferase